MGYSLVPYPHYPHPLGSGEYRIKPGDPRLANHPVSLSQQAWGESNTRRQEEFTKNKGSIGIRFCSQCATPQFDTHAYQLVQIFKKPVPPVQSSQSLLNKSAIAKWADDTFNTVVVCNVCIQKGSQNSGAFRVKGVTAKLISSVAGVTKGAVTATALVGATVLSGVLKISGGLFNKTLRR